MPANNREQFPDPDADLIYHSSRMMWWLRWLRQRRGLSVRAMEALTGISDSEIIKIEGAQQECRLSSFVRICSALGVPPGWALDVMVQSNVSLFFSRVMGDAGFSVLVETLKIEGIATKKALALDVATACMLTAILLRVSAPVRRASLHSYPTEDWRQRFLAFARRLDSVSGDIDRPVIMKSLRERPIVTLRRIGVLSVASLELKRDDLSLPKAQRRSGDFGVVAHVLAVPDVEALWGLTQDGEKQNLTNTATESKSSDVKPKDLWPALKKQLQQATAETAGAKTALAEFLDVELSRVSQWLSDSPKTAREPGAEYALLMQAWLKNPKRQGK